MDKRPFIDFKEIRSRVPIESVLSRYGIETRKVSTTQLTAKKCPLPSHDNPKSLDTFKVNTEKNVYYCHHDSCKKKGGGNVLDFVGIMQTCTPYDSAKLLAEWFPASGNPAMKVHEVASSSRQPANGNNNGNGHPAIQEPATQAANPPHPTEPENRPLAWELKGIDPGHPYLAHRGVSPETSRHFGIGFFPGKGSVSGRIAIPIRNETGELVAYAGRSINGEEPKYRLPPGFHKSLALFNLNGIGDSDCIIIVEGFFDCLKTWQAGFPSVCALMGCTMSDAHKKLIARFPKIVLMLDGDEPGRNAQNQLALTLAQSHFVRTVDVGLNRQPDQLSSLDIQKLLNGVLA